MTNRKTPPRRGRKANRNTQLFDAMIDELLIWREQQGIRTMLVVFGKESKERTSFMRLMLKNQTRLGAAQRRLDALFDLSKFEFREDQTSVREVARKGRKGK